MKLIIFDFNRTLWDSDAGKLFDDALPLLDELHQRFRLAIVAKGDIEREKLVHSLGIDSYFDEIVMKDEKCAKDYKAVMEKLGVSPSETLVVGDRAWKDVRFGNEAGARTVWFRNGKFANELPREDIEEADYIIWRLRDLREILKNNL